LDEFALAKRFKVATEEQIRMIYNGVSDVDFRASPGEAAEPTLAMVARFAPPKEQAFVLRALAAITTPYKMLFIGDGPDRDSAQAMARQLGIQDRIVFAGARTDVAELLSGCHVLVHAARYEALGLCLLEGMRAGLPVVAIATGGVPEVVEDGTTGILVEHGDLAGFRNALSKLINDPALRARMGQEGRRRFLTRFSVNRTLEALYRVYNEVTGPVRGAMPDTFHAAPDLKA
jgi:glycosyltransferase involved in cell wall biosynthesis